MHILFSKGVEFEIGDKTCLFSVRGVYHITNLVRKYWKLFKNMPCACCVHVFINSWIRYRRDSFFLIPVVGPEESYLKILFSTICHRRRPYPIYMRECVPRYIQATFQRIQLRRLNFKTLSGVRIICVGEAGKLCLFNRLLARLQDIATK